METKVRKGRQVELLRSAQHKHQSSSPSYLLVVTVADSFTVNDIIIVLFSIKFRLINIDTQRHFLCEVYHGTHTTDRPNFFTWKTSTNRHIISG